MGTGAWGSKQEAATGSRLDRKEDLRGGPSSPTCQEHLDLPLPASHP